MDLLAVAAIALGALVIQHIAIRRAQAQTGALLARISTEPRIEIRPTEAPARPDLKAPNYISDEPYMDEAWNDYRGEAAEADE